MPRRKKSLSSLRPSPRVLRRLRQLDISCNCKCSLIVSCAVGAVPGCRERRKEGTCPCRPRWLPVCILDPDTPHGCPRWREGKKCDCPEMYMPRCLARGCADRRSGHNCECPRAPIEICPHVQKLLEFFANLTAPVANQMSDAWAEQLWTLLAEQYADRPLASAGCVVRRREAVVALMTVRESLGLSLWHPQDERGMSEDAERTQRQALGLRRLLGMGSETINAKGRAA